jgi:hypothetical protein
MKELEQYFKALGDTIRLRILNLRCMVSCASATSSMC